MPTDDIVNRGFLQFDVEKDNLQNTARNVELLRKLWLDRQWIHGEAIGPGDPGDFEYGAWHIGCHLAGAAGIRRATDGRLLWLELSHDPRRDGYFASVTWNCTAGSASLPIDSADGRELLAKSELLGFVEGNSTGRTSARSVFDIPARFNLWRRQDFDQSVASQADGGKVWEHWCTLRDIRPASQMGLSVLSAYVSLVAALGDRFPAAVARGRREYGHPKQLAAMVVAGFISKEAALWDGQPTEIPHTLETEFARANPANCVESAAALDWANPPRYYMFRRRIDKWNKADAVRTELQAFEQHITGAAGHKPAEPAS